MCPRLLRVGFATFAFFLLACDEPAEMPPDAGVDARRPPPRRDAGRDANVPDAGPLPSVCDPEAAAPGPFPAPDAWEPNRGPGIGATTYEPSELGEHCAYLSGGEQDIDHHNLLAMYDGYLVMPWAPEWGGGGFSFYDISDPCSPVEVGWGYSDTMRESHSIGYSMLGGRWAVVAQLGQVLAFDRGGIQFWDFSDPTAPTHVHDLELSGFGYPDAYARVVLSTFWQVPYVYIGMGDLGVRIVNATDPLVAREVGRYEFEPVHRVGQVTAIGNLLVVGSAGEARTVLLDISDPTDPQPIPGGDFIPVDGEGQPRGAYFSNFASGYVYYARKDGGGGIIVYDVRDPERPTFAGSYRTTGSGGYVFPHEQYAFVGESSFATIYDLSDLDAIEEVGRYHLEGDLDTITPIGHIAALSVDEDANPGEGTALAPWRTEPDTRAPRLTFSWPPDGADGLPLTSRIGLSFDELIDVRSAFEGSVRLYRDGMDPDEGRVAAVISAEEAIVNIHPRCPLEPGTDYVVEVPAGGIVDYAGNALETTFELRFRTAE